MFYGNGREKASAEMTKALAFEPDNPELFPARAGFYLVRPGFSPRTIISNKITPTFCA